MNSSRKINYSTRVAKNIERKMIRDFLLRFSISYPLEKYTYIGFGSKYFTDFLMFHKYLHIDKLISIEGDVGNRKKYEFNKPLNCIRMEYGMSNEILPTIDFPADKTIIWLDYDGILEENCLTDIATLISKLDEGSMLLVSYNSRPIKPKELTTQYPDKSALEITKGYVEDNIGKNYLPHDLDYRGLSNSKKYSQTLRKVVINCITKRLEVVNRGVSEMEKLRFKQVLNFDYQDGCEMSTLGFVFSKEEQGTSKLDLCKLTDFDFYCEDDSAYEITAPNLTVKEIKSLLEAMPNDNLKLRDYKGVIAETDINNFKKVYKYLPIFSDAELA